MKLRNTINNNVTPRKIVHLIPKVYENNTIIRI